MINSRPMPTGMHDKNGVEIKVDDTVHVPGSEGPLPMNVVLLEEPGYNGLYLEDVSDIGGAERRMRVLLSAVKPEDLEVL